MQISNQGLRYRFRCLEGLRSSSIEELELFFR